VPSDYELIAQQVSELNAKFQVFEERLGQIEVVNAGLQEAASITARALQEISAHWDAVYKAMQRRDQAIRGE
jgi:hypothetical protein